MWRPSGPERGCDMYLVGCVLLGVLLGGMGTRFLRERKPELVKKVEASAKAVVDSLVGRCREADERKGNV